jgi:hypothetical protein
MKDLDYNKIQKFVEENNLSISKVIEEWNYVKPNYNKIEDYFQDLIKSDDLFFLRK